MCVCAVFGHHNYGVNQLTFFLGIWKIFANKTENWSTQLVFEFIFHKIQTLLHHLPYDQIVYLFMNTNKDNTI